MRTGLAEMLAPQRPCQAVPQAQRLLQARRASSLHCSTSGHTHHQQPRQHPVLARGVGGSSSGSSNKSNSSNGSIPAAPSDSSSNGASASASSNAAGQQWARHKRYDVVALSNLCVDVVVNMEALPPPDVEARRQLLEQLSATPPPMAAWEVGVGCGIW